MLTQTIVRHAEAALAAIGEEPFLAALAADELPDVAGVLTPMVALGDALAERLRRHDFTVETVRLG